MQEYDFIVTFSLQNKDEDPIVYEEALERNDCTDALLGIGSKGFIALDFCREASSAYEAISSAISAVKRSIPGAILTKVEPDLVGITDIAELVNRSRQNVRKLMYADDSGCPMPVHNGNPSLWHLHDLLDWLENEKSYEIRSELLEVAQISKGLNALVLWNQIEPEMRQEAQSMTTRVETPQFGKTILSV